ncbi:hypothetical protein PBY51_017203 [Eleginops maclovinus]|uniref:Protein kinase domain-containing protein n=1 Tax=Eleginops maclovinus TaxID=56733 RepID=A0AAN7XJD1_ELEMC|nr:hypothetical protein PBY51_017203 [Eleginops maclovinus]
MMEYLRAFDSDRFNFVTYNDAFISGEILCLEFELLDVSLFDFLYLKPNSRSLSVKEIRPILYQVAVTLQFIQCLGVVHTDLKPENIMLVDHVKQPWKVKVIDFGVACHISQPELGDYMQTRHYRSPEVILGFPITSAIDMWSLGCIATELLSGSVLYPGDTEYEMLQHIVATQGQPPARLMDSGLKTRWFFHKRRRGRRRRWTLKNAQQYGETNTSLAQFNSLNDIIKLHTPHHLLDEDTAAETEDQQAFLDLVKKMLHLDVGQRISPSELLQHPFITMNNLAENFPSSFYVKSSCEKMEVCLDQTQGFDVRGQQPRMTLQSSVSRAKGLPAWYRTQEHPLTLGISSQVLDSLSINDDQNLPQQPPGRSFATKSVSPALQANPTAVAPSCQKERTGRKMTRKSSRRKPCSDDNSPERDGPSSKSRKTEIIQTEEKFTQTQMSLPVKKSDAREAPIVAPSCAASGLRKQVKVSPENKTIKSDESEVAGIKPGRKRTWDTYLASHIELKSESSGSPERKKRKMSLDEEEIKTQSSSLSTRKRKRPPGEPPEGKEEPRCVKKRRY